MPNKDESLKTINLSNVQLRTTYTYAYIMYIFIGGVCMYVCMYADV